MTSERNDPTHAGFTPPSSPTVQLSCNELEVLCLKAARGAGLSWGLAEEAGFAIRWLFSRGIDGAGVLLSHLDEFARISSKVDFRDGAFRANEKGSVCPIAVGAAISDFASDGRCDFHAEKVRRPILILPFLHGIAAASGGTQALIWVGGRVTVSAGGEVSGEVTILSVEDEADVAIAPVTVTAEQQSSKCGYSRPTKDVLTRLNTYAMLTTVPASASSRADAGSAGSDND